MRFSSFKFLLPCAIVLSCVTQLSHAANERIKPSGFECSPDCVNDFSSLGGDVTYSVVGTTGTFSYVGTPGNVVLQDQDLDAGTLGLGDPDGQNGYAINPFHLNPFTPSPEKFEFSFSFDTSLLAGANGGFSTSSGSLDVNGATVQASGGSAVTTINGIDLVGDLLTSNIFEFGYLDDEIESGSSGSTLIVDFLGVVDVVNSLIADIAIPLTPAQGQATISLDDIANYDRNIAWYEQNWTGAANVNVVVPVPPAVFMFASAMIGLFGFAAKRAKS